MKRTQLQVIQLLGISSFWNSWNLSSNHKIKVYVQILFVRYFNYQTKWKVVMYCMLEKQLPFTLFTPFHSCSSFKWSIFIYYTLLGQTFNKNYITIALWLIIS